MKVWHIVEPQFIDHVRDDADMKLREQEYQRFVDFQKGKDHRKTEGERYTKLDDHPGMAQCNFGCDVVVSSVGLLISRLVWSYKFAAVFLKKHYEGV